VATGEIGDGGRRWSHEKRPPPWGGRDPPEKIGEVSKKNDGDFRRRG